MRYALCLSQNKGSIMRLSETDDIKSGIKKREILNHIELHDKDYITGNTIVDKMGDELLTSNFSVLLVKYADGDDEYKNITCHITYYRHANCISQNLNRLIKKYKKYTKSVFSESDKVETPSTYYYNLRKNRAVGFYHQNTNTLSVGDRLGIGNKFVAEMKNYIQYHPLFLQIGGDIEKYDVVSWDGVFLW